MEKQTLGERRVRVNFNVSDDSMIHKIKTITAGLIDQCEEIRNLPKKSGESFSDDREAQRLLSLAQTAYEEACMYAVKALTS